MLILMLMQMQMQMQMLMLMLMLMLMQIMKELVIFLLKTIRLINPKNCKEKEKVEIEIR